MVKERRLDKEKKNIKRGKIMKKKIKMEMLKTD